MRWQDAVTLGIGGKGAFSDPDERSRSLLGAHLRLWGLSQQQFEATETLQGAGGEFNPRLHLALHEVIANQLADNDPLAARRAIYHLVDDHGYDPHDAAHHLMSLLSTHVYDALKGNSGDPQGYVDDLEQLALGNHDALDDDDDDGACDVDHEGITDAILDVVGDEPLRIDALVAGLVATGETANDIRHVLDELLSHPEAPVACVGSDLVVPVQATLARAVLTHRVTAEEIAADALTIVADLDAFDRLTALDALSTAPPSSPGAVHLDRRDDALAWAGPSGWLAHLADGQLVAVTVRDGVVTVAPVPPEVDENGCGRPTTATVLALHEELKGEPPLPVPIEDLVLAGLIGSPPVFTAHGLPLGELFAAAGLETRGGAVAGSADQWTNAERAQLVDRLITLHYLPAGRISGTIELLEHAARLAAGESVDPVTLRRLLRDGADPLVANAVAAECLELGAMSRYTPGCLAALAAAIEQTATRPADRAVAWLWQARLAERDGRTLDAEQLAKRTVMAAPDHPLALADLARFTAERGDAVEAVKLYRRAGAYDDDAEIAELLPFVPEPTAATASHVGRNDSCPCGSGRKYKHCHLGQTSSTVDIPLSRRIDWLWSKHASFFERNRAHDALFELTTTWPGELDDDPVIDLLLAEAGWAARYLDERGVLLPADELELAKAWLATTRRIWTVMGHRSNRTVTLRAAGGADDPITARWLAEGDLPHRGEVICARVGRGGGPEELAVLPGHMFIDPDEDALAKVTAALATGDPATILATFSTFW